MVFAYIIKTVIRLIFILGILLINACGMPNLRGTGDLGLVIERAIGQVQIIETTNYTSLYKISGLGDLSHASVVYSRDQRYGYIFGRDGGLSKIDMLRGKITKRIIQAGNSIGGAISQDGKLIAVSNYKPGGVKIFDADSLKLILDIPTIYDDNAVEKRSKTVGLTDAPGNKFIFSLYDSGEIWLVDMKDINQPIITKFKDIGDKPYDGLITSDGRYYIAGLFGEDGMAMLDLWNLDAGVTRILDGYGRDDEALPVYKMPHLEGWAQAGNLMFLPAIGHHKVLSIARDTWQVGDSIPVHSQPVFVVSRPDGKYIWVNFAHPDNDVIQIIDVEAKKIIKELRPGKAVLHMEFTPRGEHILISVRDENKVIIYDTQSFEEITNLEMDKPSGIFLTARSAKTGL